MREPAEGTILTVAREMAHQIVTDVAHSENNPRFGPETAAREQDSAIAEALERAVEAGQESVKRGPELLAALRDAGVVDAGGYGLTIIFAGVVAALRGEEPPPLEHYAPARITHPEHSSGTYRFCTNFAVTGSGLVAARFVEPLEELGDSVLVVGDETTLKVHLHTDEPERATAVFAGAGEVSRLDVADMRAQVAERDERLGAGAGDPAEGAGAASAPRAIALRGEAGAGAVARCGAVAVVSGEGLREMFRELGVHTIDGGPTLNPSTYDLLAAIHAVPAEEVVVLPNSANVIMAAEHAARLSDKQVLVAPTTSQQAGLAAAVSLCAGPLRRGERERDRRGARTGAHGRRRAGRPRRRPGALQERRGGRLRRRARCSPGAMPPRRCAPCWPSSRGPWTGRGARADQRARGRGRAARLAELEDLVDGDVELELRHGGQSAYWWLLAAE